MNLDQNESLDGALALLGYNEDAPTHLRCSLLRAIHAHAVSTRNEGLAHACEARIHLIEADTNLDVGGVGDVDGVQQTR